MPKGLETATEDWVRLSRECMELARWVAKEDPSCIWLGPHAKKQMQKRGLVFRDIERTLRVGDPIGRPKRGKNAGEVKLEIAFKPKGSREIVVVTIVVKERKTVFVKTVMWKDER